MGPTSEQDRIYWGNTRQATKASISRWLDSPPPWRRLSRPGRLVDRLPPDDADAVRRGQTYVTSGDDELFRVNLALILRRPLMVTGPAGIGKSTLAYSIAWCLGLGTPMRWEINSQVALQNGLYSYDSVGHLQAAQPDSGTPAPVGDFITLGPLGTALLPTALPRVLLIDELDKASYDLPNDLLHVFEEGSFGIPELIRAGGESAVFPFDSRNKDDRVTIQEGRVVTAHHPVVVITSNGERTFSEPFLRRCVCLDMSRPNREQLARIVRAQLGDAVPPQLEAAALERYQDQATDVVLQALFAEAVHGQNATSVEEALKRR